MHSTDANVSSAASLLQGQGADGALARPDQLPSSGDSAARILDGLCAIIAYLDWSAFSPGMQVTSSAGGATLKPNEPPDALLARADSALYSAKGRGRNHIANA